MTRDAIVEEARAARDKIASEHDYDIAAIFAALRAMEARGEVERVTLPSRPAEDASRAQTALADRASRRG
jgi:hypothetical protein